MDNNVIELAYKLYDELINSNEYKSLKVVEAKMLANKRSSKLISDYKELEEKYSNDKSEVMLKKLHKAKLAMDLDLLVIEYKNAYKKYQLLTSNITDIVFKDFKDESLIEKMCKRILDSK